MNREKVQRGKVFSVRLTPEEWRELQRRAAKKYLPLSAYVRQRLFGEQSKQEDGAHRGVKR